MLPGMCHERDGHAGARVPPAHHSSSSPRAPVRTGSAKANNLSGLSSDELNQITRRILAMATAIWPNQRSGAPITRSLTAYEHRSLRNHSSDAS